MDFSRESYRERLRTFSASKWFGKPANLSPLKVALHGWHCIKENTLACQCCNAIVYTSIDSRLGSEMRSKAADMILDKIRNGHKVKCMWAGSPSPKSFAEIPSNTQQIAAEVASRVAILKKDSAYRSIVLSPQITDRIISSNVIQYRLEYQLSKEIIIAATGWRPVLPHPPPRRGHGLSRNNQSQQKPTEASAASCSRWSDKIFAATNKQQQVIILECTGCMQRIRVMLQENHQLLQQRHNHPDDDKEDDGDDDDVLLDESTEGSAIILSNRKMENGAIKDTTAASWSNVGGRDTGVAAASTPSFSTTTGMKRRRITGATPHNLESSSTSSTNSNKHAFQGGNIINKLFDPLKFHRAYCPFIQVVEKKEKKKTVVTGGGTVVTIEHGQGQEHSEKKVKIKDNQEHDQGDVYEGWEKCLVSYLKCFGEEGNCSFAIAGDGLHLMQS